MKEFLFPWVRDVFKEGSYIAFTENTIPKPGTSSYNYKSVFQSFILREDNTLKVQDISG